MLRDILGVLWLEDRVGVSLESASFAGASREGILAATEPSKGFRTFRRLCAALDIEILTVLMRYLDGVRGRPGGVVAVDHHDQATRSTDEGVAGEPISQVYMQRTFYIPWLVVRWS
jgi:hypothetical protein